MRFIFSLMFLVFSALIFSQADTTSPTAAITYSAAGPYNNNDTVTTHDHGDEEGRE
jgi:hypothetical protein